jgi:hypothetical protein
MDFDRIGQIVDNISTKLAIISDDKLEGPLNEYVPKLLNLLLVDNENVRKKLMSALTLIRRRLTANESIVYDFKPLIKLYLSENAFLKNFTKIFMDMAFQRNQTKETLWEDILLCLESNQDPVFYGYLLQCLPHVTKSVGKVTHLLPLFQNILLCKDSVGDKIPDGVDPSFLFILKNVKVDVSMKLNILKFLKQVDLPGNMIYILVLIASLDEQEAISSIASDMMKKTFFEWNEALIDKIFEFYKLKPMEKIRIKLIQALMNSPISASKSDSILVLNDAFFSESASTKLKTLGVQYFLYFVEKTDLQEVTPIFISIMNNLNSGESEQFYLALGVFLKKWPKTIDHSTDLFKMYFEALKTKTNKIPIQQGLYAFLSSVTNAGENEEEFLLSVVASRSDAVLTSAIYCVNQMFPFSNVVARFINLYCIEKSTESGRGIDLEGFCKYRQVTESKVNDWPDFDPFVDLVSKCYLDKNFTFPEVVRVEILKFLQKCKNQVVTPQLLKWLSTMMSIHASSSLIYEICHFLLPLVNFQNVELITTSLTDVLMLHLYQGNDLSRDVVARLLATFYVVSKKNLFELNFESKQENVHHGTWSFYGYYIYYYFCCFGSFPKYLVDLETFFSSKPTWSSGLVTFVGKLLFDPIWRLSCIKLFSKWITKTEDIPRKEKMVTSLGYIADSTVLDLLFGLGSSASEELHFTLGETLSLLFANESCSLWPKYFLQVKPESSSEKQLVILKHIVQGTSSRTKMIRFSSCVHLLALVRFCTSPLFEKHLNEIQKAFLCFMSDNNSVIQEIACKGLTQFYTIASPENKVLLTNNLVMTFSGKRETEELVLFSEKPQLGTNLANYKDLLSVANEIGRPEMVYSFLSYTSSHIILKKAKTSSLFVPVSPEMIPKIYRYQYDPNPLISLPIREMWKSLDIVKMDPYIPFIMADLMTNLNSNDHKTRQACCIALMDLLIGKTFSDMSKYLVKLFPLVWRVMDDMKDASRLAALQVSERLGGFLIKSCDPNFTNHVNVSLKLIVPILMDGLVFSAEIVRGWSLEYLEKIISISGTLIRPFIETIMIMLLENMTLLEPSQLNYIQNMIGSDDKKTTETIERLKSEMISNNPIWKCISICEKYLDNDLVTILIPKMLELLKSSVGTTARQGTAKLLSMMIPLYPGGIKPHVKAILRLIFHLVKQSSVTNIEKSMLTKCVPKLIPLGKVSDVKLVIAEIVDLYKSGNSICANLCQLVVNEVWHLVKGYFDPILPIIFIARLDDDGKVWNEVWNELSLNVGDYNDLFIKECDVLLEDSNWTFKQRGVKGLVEFASFNKENEEFMELIIKHLKKTYFPGKEQLLVCLSKLTLKSVPTLLLEECRKSNVVYKTQALKSLLLLGKQDLKFLDFLEFEFAKSEELEIRKMLIQLIPNYSQDDYIPYMTWIKNTITSMNTSEILEVLGILTRLPKNDIGRQLLKNYETHQNTLVKDAIAKLSNYYGN